MNTYRNLIPLGRISRENPARYVAQAEEAIEWLAHYGCNGEGKAIATA